MATGEGKHANVSYLYRREIPENSFASIHRVVALEDHLHLSYLS